MESRAGDSAQSRVSSSRLPRRCRPAPPRIPGIGIADGYRRETSRWQRENRSEFTSVNGPHIRLAGNVPWQVSQFRLGRSGGVESAQSAGHRTYPLPAWSITCGRRPRSTDSRVAGMITTCAPSCFCGPCCLAGCASVPGALLTDDYPRGAGVDAGRSARCGGSSASTASVSLGTSSSTESRLNGRAWARAETLRTHRSHMTLGPRCAASRQVVVDELITQLRLAGVKHIDARIAVVRPPASRPRHLRRRRHPERNRTVVAGADPKGSSSIRGRIGSLRTDRTR